MRTTARGSGPVPLASCLCAAALTAAAATGCSSGSGGGSGTLGALRHLAAAEHSAKQVTYVDSARVRELGKADAKRFARVGQPGSALLNQYAAGPWGDSLKPAQIDTAVDSPAGGHWDGRFDADAVVASLKKRGFTSTEHDGRRVWKPSGGSGPAFTISAKEIAYTAASGSGTPGDPDAGASLADRPDYRQAADCLGDVYRADFNSLRTDAPVRLSVLGQQAAGSPARNTEVLCAVVEDRATADRLAAKLRGVVTAKAPTYDGTRVTVDKGDHPVVRAAVPDGPSQQAGRLLLSDFDLFMAVGSL